MRLNSINLYEEIGYTVEFYGTKRDLTKLVNVKNGVKILTG